MMEMVKSLLEENGYPTEGLTEETSFESLGVDSLGLVDLTLSLEQKGYTIPKKSYLKSRPWAICSGC